MSKTCLELCSSLACSIEGDAQALVTGLAYRSDAVHPGDAFFCIVGTVSDGHAYAQDAVNRGASVLVVEREVSIESAGGVTIVKVRNTRLAMASMASAFYDYPSRAFDLVGITGTNGKTTTSFLVEHIARCAGDVCGYIGTVGIDINGLREEAHHTTPESCDLQLLFVRMRDAGCKTVVMEVSSHALALERVWDTHFAVTAFTNLTQDHLDYHHTFEDYFAAKARLFSQDYPAQRVINVSDTYGARLAAQCLQAGESVLTFGRDASADIYPEHVEMSHKDTHIELAYRTGDGAHAHLEFTYPLVGDFNVENVMCAFGIALQLGMAPDDIARALASATAAPGRLQRVQTEHDGGVSVYVDYAHTPDALKKAIASVKALTPTSNRTFVVFGCGGNRDAGKRPLMGAEALAADFAIVTSDNPRHEEPMLIINDVVAGMRADSSHFEVELDRRRAIARAIELARPGDTILLAGKGHEDYQLVGDEVLSFDDCKVAAEELEKAFGTHAA